MSLLRTSLLLTPLVLLARGAAFLVPVLWADWFGVDWRIDAFYYALNVPTFLLVVGNTALSTVLLPLLAEKPLPEASLAWRIGGIAAAIEVLFALCLGPLIPHLTAFDLRTQAETIRFAWMLVPFVGLTAAASVLRTGCDVRGHFSSGALGPLWRAGGALGVAAWFRTPESLPAAMAVGVLLEIGWYRLQGGARFGKLPSEVGPRLWGVLPVLGGEALVASNSLVDQAFAATLAPGSVSLLAYADRVRLAPQTLLEATLVLVAFSTWARLPAAERPKAVLTGLRQVLSLTPPVLGGLAVGSLALVRLLFEHGAFQPDYSPPVAATVAAFMPSVLASLLGALLMKAHVLHGRFGLVLRLGLLSSASNIVFDAILGPVMGVPGLGWGTSLTTILLCSIAGYLWWKGEEDGVVSPQPGWKTAGGVLVGSLILALLLYPQQFSSVRDPALWGAAIPFVLLLILGGRALKGAP